MSAGVIVGHLNTNPLTGGVLVSAGPKATT